MGLAGVLLFVTLLLVVLGVVERAVHRKNLGKIRHRIHVNGTRGKSSVTRLVAAGLRQGGLTTCAKTTGTLARMILPDAREVPVYRPAEPNIIEQKRIVGTAAAYGSDVLVVECMALQPELQSLCELDLIRSTCAVITNARPDHLDVMGPGEEDVARALAGMVPVGGKLFTAERKHLNILKEAAADRETELVVIDDDAVDAIDDSVLDGFPYREHPDNVALALAVCEELGVDRDTALRGMHSAKPDPGAMTEHRLDFFGRSIHFVHGFAANDPVSTRQIWEMALERHSDVERRIAIFNCRGDRPERSMQLGKDYASWPPADHVLLMGTGTYLFARAATRAGADSSKLVFVERQTVEEVFEQIISLSGRSALVMGMGNVGGDGLDLVRYFRNREPPPQLAAPSPEPAP